MSEPAPVSASPAPPVPEPPPEQLEFDSLEAAEEKAAQDKAQQKLAAEQEATAATAAAPSSGGARPGAPASRAGGTLLSWRAMTFSQLVAAIGAPIKRSVLNSVRSQVKQAADGVAGKIEQIADAVEMRCDPDTSDKVDGVSLPRALADLVDSLRLNNPRAYQLLVDAAVAHNDASARGQFSERKPTCLRLASELEQRLSAPPFFFPASPQ